MMLLDPEASAEGRPGSGHVLFGVGGTDCGVVIVHNVKRGFLQ